MLDAFILRNRDAIVARAHSRVRSRACPAASDDDLANGIPVFLDQLGDALRLAKSTDVVDHDALGKTAGRHGHDLLLQGVTVGQVVHDYGDVCQTITELAVEQDATISAFEFKTLNLCLDDAIAEAVSEYGRQRERKISHEGTERLGVLAHELRSALNTAMLSFDSIQSGRVASSGSTGLVHARSLLSLRTLIDESLAEVRLEAGVLHVETISVAEFIEEVEIGALIQARSRGLNFAITSVDRSVAVEGDRQLLASAISNLLQNAFKLTPRRGNVSLTVDASTDRVLFAVEDECGGLPLGKAEDLALPLAQRGSHSSDAGLGLSICIKAAKANGGEVRVRDMPGKGCVFTLDLPRKPPALSSSSSFAPDPIAADLDAKETDAGANIAMRIAAMRRNPSVALTRLVGVHEAAEASRSAVRTFLAMDPDELSLSDWLAGPYREATSFDPRRTPTQRPPHPLGARPTPGTDIPALVTTAKNLVLSALGAAQRGIDDLLQHLPPIVHVEPVHDAYGSHGFIPVDEANMRLVDRVLALLVVDYLTRPHDYGPHRHPFSGDDSRLHVAPLQGRMSGLAAGARR
jgi:signal transduction histidine kinase